MPHRTASPSFDLPYAPRSVPAVRPPPGSPRCTTRRDKTGDLRRQEANTIAGNITAPVNLSPHTFLARAG
jgi:hypothetical protein